MEVDLQIAFEMERQITDGREALACGCLVKVLCSFPNAPWIYPQWPTIFCSLHDQGVATPGHWISIITGHNVAHGVIHKAVSDSIRVHLPYIHMDEWLGPLHERQALISLEGQHVIRHDGRVFKRPSSAVARAADPWA